MEADLLVPLSALRADLQVPRYTPAALVEDYTDEPHLLLLPRLRSVAILSYGPSSCLVVVSSPMDGLVISVPTGKLALDVRKPVSASRVDGADVVAGIIARLFGLDVPGAGVWQWVEQGEGTKIKIGSFSTRLAFEAQEHAASPRHALAFVAQQTLGWADAGLERRTRSVETEVAASVATSVVTTLDRCSCEESLRLRHAANEMRVLLMEALDLPAYSTSILKSRLDRLSVITEDLLA